jgi:hypothetical protein
MMRTAAVVMILGAFGPALPSKGDTEWTYVPASLQARSLEAFAVPAETTEKVVAYVGAIAPPVAVTPNPGRVFGFDFPTPSPEETVSAQPVTAVPRAVPNGAHWPDSGGRIAAVPPASRDAKDPGIRNPWEVRVRRMTAPKDISFVCGGIVAGGDGGAIGILNGRIIKKGDSVGRYIVADVLPIGVLLERDGSYFVIPRGARTTITTAGGE